MIYREITEEEYSVLPNKKGLYKVNCNSGSIIWMKDKGQHRADGYSFVGSAGPMEWQVNGLLHRTDGPAIISKDAERYWSLNGLSCSKEEWFDRLTPEQRAIALANTENF